MVKYKPWIKDVNSYKLNDIMYWIHRTEESKNNWLLTNFNYNITNLDLKTDDLALGEQRSLLILRNKIFIVNNAIDTISQMTDKYKKNRSISPNLTSNLIKFADQIKFF